MSGTPKPPRLATLARSFGLDEVPWWLVLRLLAYFYSFITGIVEALRMRHSPGLPAPTQPDPFAGGDTITFGFLLVAFVFVAVFVSIGAVMVASVVAAAGSSPRNRAKGPWSRPTHGSNPFFGVSSHLAFLHFAGYGTLSLGLGLVLGGLFVGAAPVLIGLALGFFGGTFLAGLYAGMHFCRDRFEVAEGAESAEQAGDFEVVEETDEEPPQ
jgi:hypothetical protein